MEVDILHPLYQNFVCVYWAFAFVGKSLEEYTKSGIKKVHQRICTQLAGRKPCNQKCSKTHGNNINSWCPTCKAWKQKLQCEVQHRKTWDKAKSWKWPKEHYAIVEIFLPSRWSGEPDLKDLSTASNVWLSCKNEYRIQKQVVRSLLNFRNKYFAHNPHLQVTDLEKAAVFDTLRDLIKDKDVSCYVNVQHCLNKLEIIQKGDQTNIGDRVLTELNKISNNFDVTNVTQQQLCIVFKEITMRQEQQLWNIKLLHAKIPFNTWMFAAIVAVIAIYVTLLAWKYNTIQDEPPSTRTIHLQKKEFGSNCIKENYTYPFEQDLPLLGYLRNDNEFFGRKWLINNIERDILNISDKITRGVAVVADMGYGKSALIYHLLCAKSSANAQNVYKHIVAFHVCKFDVSSTRTPERFIKRMVGFFATKSAEYCDIISRLSNSSIIYNLDACSREIEACFDQGISLPLSEIKNTAGETWIIVLDALDECYEKKLKSNPILELLSTRSRKLPYWLKFLITSRNMSDLARLDRYTFQNLTPSDSRNVADMKLFVESKSSEHTEMSLSWISRILKQSEGNFLYLTFLEFNYTQDHIQDWPKSLADIYELNFGNQFDKENYSLSKNILEVISAQTEPIPKKDIFDILNKSYHIDSNTFEQALERLSFFMNFDSVVSFKHQNILRWLTSMQSGRFSISVANGHKLISRYLMSSIKQNLMDIVELAIHVAQSEDEEIVTLFNILPVHTHTRSVIHRAIWKTSSVDALNLLMRHYPDVNVINEDGISPAFVAAAKGHLEQLKYLQSKGEDMNFTVPTSFQIIATDISKKLHLMKTVYHSGFNLMHIAAQHGRLAVVEYLIDLNPSLIALKNSVGLRPIDTACEQGHLDIVRKLHAVGRKFLGLRCLFYASKFSQIDIVRYVLESGLKMNCISNKQSKEGITSAFSTIDDYANSSISTSVFPKDSADLTTIKPIDSWWLIFKETPLHAAIRSGSINVAKFILEKFPDAVNCSDGFGFTPALAAVAYNRTELMPMFKHRLEHEQCSPIPLHLITIAKQYGQNYIENSLCPENATFAHIVAIYNRFDMIRFVLKERLHVPWSNSDANGDTPIHYAASHASVYFIHFIRMKFTVDVDVARNGSNAYHIAALTGQCRSMFALTDNLQIKIANVKDVLNRGIMHHIVLRSLKPYDYDEFGQHCSYLIFKYLVEICGHSIHHRDYFKRNVLHYAFKNGHMLVTNYIRTMFTEEYNTLIEEEDINALTPIQYAIVNNKKYPIQILARKCSFMNTSHIACRQNEELHDLMPHWEVVLIRHTCELKVPLSFIQRHLVPYLHEILRNAPYLTLALQVYHNDLSDAMWEQQILKAINLGELTWSSLTIFGRHRPQILHKCGKPINASPLHLFMLKFSPQESVFASGNSDVNWILSTLFHKPYNNSNFGCSDENGYNIFHYSLLSGNLNTANDLLQYGIAIANRRISIIDIFFLCLSSKIQLSFQQHQILHDQFLANFVGQYSYKIKSRDLCRYNSLSIVHILSMSGMLNTLQKILEMYGLETLGCSNKFGVSPLYLAELFGETKTANMLKKYMKLAFPDGAAEEYLLLNMLNNFPLQNDSETISKLLKIVYHDVVKKHLRYFYRVYTFVKRLDKFSFFSLTMHGNRMLLHVFPFLLKSVSNIGAILFNKNTTENCALVRNQIALLMETVKIYQNLSEIQFQSLYHDILPNKKYVLHKVMKTLSNIMKLKALSEPPLNSRTCSELKAVSTHLYRNVMSLAGQVTDLCQNYAVYHYFHYLKNNLKTFNPSIYDFVRSRKEAFQFPVTLYQTQPLIKPIDILVRNFRFLDVIKGTWAYREMRSYIISGLGHSSASITVQRNELKQLKDPLLQLNKSSNQI